MRVTNNLLADSAAGNLMKNAERLPKTQEMISSGKRITRPSDDPIGIDKVLDHRKTVSSIDQYGRNIAHGKSWLELTDSTLDSVGELLKRAKEVAITQANEIVSEESREGAAKDVENIYDQILLLANTKLGNNYMFAGHKTDNAPFSRDEAYNATYTGDSGDIRIIVGENVETKINFDGGEIFGCERTSSGEVSSPIPTGSSSSLGGVDVFDVLHDLRDGLKSNNTSVISDQFDPLDEALKQIIGVRAEAGVKLNRMDSAENHWEYFNLNIRQLLSDTEDTDIVKAISDLMSQEIAYQASLAISARVIQPTLIDFLK